jgi:Cytochrome P450
MNSIHLKANTNVIVGIAAVNCDPLIWGNDAEEWKPERWLGQGLDIASEKLPGVYSGM